MPGVVCLAVLLPRFLWHAGSQKIVHCVIQYTDKTNTNSLRLVDSLSHTRRPYQSASSHTSLPKRVRPLPSPTQAQQAMPSSQRACLNLRSRLAATAAGQVPRIHDSPSDDPGCFTSKPKRSYPGPWLASAATPIIRQYWGVHVVHRRCRQHTIFPRHLYSAIVRPDVLGGEHGARHQSGSDSGKHATPRGTSSLSKRRRETLYSDSAWTIAYIRPLRRHNSLHPPYPARRLLLITKCGTEPQVAHSLDPRLQFSILAKKTHSHHERISPRRITAHDRIYELSIRNNPPLVHNAIHSSP